MSGHSKWANIKHRKSAQDAKRGKTFQKYIRAVMVASREGGSDPSMNIRLKSAIERARAANVPVDTIEKAVKKGAGDMEGVTYDEITYEGYGSGGVAVLVDVLTDNKNRTASEMRLIFSRSGGSLGESGCVSWIFQRKGVIRLSGKDLDEEQLLMVCLEAGADDLEKNGEGFSVYCDPAVMSEVRETLAEAGYVIEGSEIEKLPKTTVQIKGKQEAEKLLRFLETLEDHDDVQNVYANFDIPDDIMEELAG
ncbi:MAG TPA: YebC/PmpR family DNA-binding transcriptional regulator [Synergistales bacterium]|nr:YebC/PmpR family DNA-binding transcriptional regulator [Synergistales bacterium]HQO82514.1 YebC/PmpR family DNA-binding transcriptional regulator [Synergistales bacterium]HQQ10093.1 YebC/PmpR family DNA-binding transcriptional regulator [Synergistales bacterium]